MADSCENAEKLVVNVTFPFTLATPKYGPSRPFVGDRAAKAAYVDALEAELASLDDDVKARPVGAVHLCGGASIMSADKVSRLVRTIKKTFPLARGAQISIDVEPLTVCTPSLTDWTGCGVTRVNLAMLSADDDELRALGAPHDRERLQSALLFLEKFHMTNVSLEELYGLPGQSVASWEKTLLTAAALEVPHIRVRPLVDVRGEGSPAAPASAPAAAPASAADGPDAPGHAAPAVKLPSSEERAAYYERASSVLAGKGYTQYAPGDFVKDDAPHARDAFGELVRGGADVLGLGAGAKTRMDGFMYENALDFGLYVEKSADFEAIVRNPLREDEAARAARVAPAFESLGTEERLARIEELGRAYTR